MKLTKNKLNKLLRNQLIEQGFMPFKDSIEGTAGLYCKSLDNGIYLSLGLNISHLYDDQFTCDLYLSTTTRIGCSWGDIPKESYTRPGYLLTKEELKPYNEDNSIVKDIWWHSEDDAINNFLHCVSLTTKRLCNDSELKQRIRESQDANTLKELSQKVTSRVKNIQLEDCSQCSYIPYKSIDDIPMIWFISAEATLKEIPNQVINKALVKSLAADAWRLHCLTTKSS